MTQTQQVKQLLDDGSWHCGNEINQLWIKDDRKCISELIKEGYEIISMPCDLHNHNSKRLLKRKLIIKPIQKSLF